MWLRSSKTSVLLFLCLFWVGSNAAVYAAPNLPTKAESDRCSVPVESSIAVDTTSDPPNVLTQPTDTRKVEADRLLLQGIQELQKGQAYAAISLLQQSEKLYQAVSDPQGESLAFQGLSHAFDEVNDLSQEAQDARYHSHFQRGKLELRPDPVQSLVGLSLIYNVLGKQAEAVSQAYLRLAIARNNYNHIQERQALLALGTAHTTLGEPARAVQFYQEGLKLSQHSQDQTTEQAMLDGLGKAYFLLGENARSIEYHQRNLAVSREQQDPKREQQALLSLGSSYASIGDVKKAINNYQDALKLQPDPQLKATALIGIAHTYAAQGDYLKAMEFYQKGSDIIDRQQMWKLLGWFNTALNIVQTFKYFSYPHGSNNRLPTFNSLVEALGIHISFEGAFAALGGFFTRSLLIAKGSDDHRGETTALFGLGRSLASSGEYAKAVDYYQQSLIKAQKGTEDKPQELAALIGLTNVYNALGDYDKAQKYYQKTVNLAQEVKALPQGETDSHIAYHALGEYSKAILFYQQSLAIACQRDDQKSESEVLVGFANAYAALGDHARALHYYQQGLDLTRKLPDRSVEGNILIGLGDVYLALGDYAKAVDVYQQTLKIAQDLQEHAATQVALNELGRIYPFVGEYDKAIAAQRQSLALAKESKNQSSELMALLNLSKTYFLMGKYEDAISQYQQSLDLAKKLKDLSSKQIALLGLGKSYVTQSKTVQAIEFYQQSLQIARKLKDRQQEGAVLSNLGEVFYRSGHLTEAEKALRESLQIRESLRSQLEDNQKVSLLDAQQNSYSLLQQVLVAENQPEAALEVAERSRSGVFSELLMRQLAKTSPSQAAPPMPPPPNLEQIKKIAQAQRATLVMYSIIDDDVVHHQGGDQNPIAGLYIWVIQPTGVVTFRKVFPAPLLDKLVTDYQRVVGLVRSPAPNPSSYQLRDLHKLLIEPIADILPAEPNDLVIFIPQGSLWAVPFAALQDANGKYLIQHHTPITAVSIQSIDLTQKLVTQHPLVKSNSLIVGNPTLQTPLPEAEKEANEIAQLLGTKALTGAQATKTQILAAMPQASVIHFATHGKMDDINGLDSKVFLAPSGNDNGWLTAADILGLKLQANLVVLSACETAEGKITGDGVIGLSRSLIAAGVPSVVVSLWDVDDASTKFLMLSFYQTLQRSPDKAQALRQAMLKTMENPQYRDPKLWAAFVLVGQAN